MPKGPLITAMEEDADALRDAMVADSRAISEAQGDAPFGSTRRSPREVALKLLPIWLVFGQADDLLSVPWWADVTKAKGPADTAALDADMREAWEDEDLRREAFMSAPPELADYLRFLMYTGLHTGKPRPQAQDAPSDASGGPREGREAAMATPMGVYA